MKITIFDCKKEGDFSSVYYPHYMTEWAVEYRSIFGKRKEKITMMTDRIKGGCNIADQLPDFVSKEAEASTVMEGKMKQQECMDESFETVRRYYIHHVRSWSVPKIRLLNNSCVYVPYQLIHKSGRWSKKIKTFLYEPMSESSERLEKFPEIFRFIKKEAEKV